MADLLTVAIGGALGASARYAFLQWAYGQWTGLFPFGLMAVNVIGSLLMGALAAFLLARSDVGDTQLKLFLATGVLGGFTTFSAYSLDVLQLIENGNIMMAIIYALGSVLLSLLAVYGGYYFTCYFTGRIIG